MNDVPRQPQGTPVGGQFAPDRKPEGGDIEVKFADNKSYNAQGTALHPPLPRDARQVVDFWATVEMPDHLLGNIATADLSIPYGGARMYYKDALKAHKELVKDVHRPAWRRKGDYREDSIPYLKDLYSMRLHHLQKSPRHIPPDELQQVARMGHASIQGRTLEFSEAQRVFDALFPYGNETKTPREIWNKYALWEIENAFFERVKYRLAVPQK